MNRRHFFRTLGAVVGAASLSPTIFIPKFEPVKWKVAAYAGVPINCGSDILGSTARRLFAEQDVTEIRKIAWWFCNSMQAERFLQLSEKVNP